MKTLLIRVDVLQHNERLFETVFVPVTFEEEGTAVEQVFESFKGRTLNSLNDGTHDFLLIGDKIFKKVFVEKVVFSAVQQ